MNVIKKLLNSNRSLLSDVQIKDHILKGQLVQIPNGIAKHESVQPNSYDLSLSSHVSKLLPNSELPDGTPYIDPKLPMEHETFEMGEKLIIQPQEFLLLSTAETLVIPNGIVGFVCGRSSIARLGIQTEQAGLIDAGFTGTITLEVCNQTKYPIVLYPNMRVAQVYFFKAAHADTPYGDTGKNSKYNHQSGAVGSLIHLDK